MLNKLDFLYLFKYYSRICCFSSEFSTESFFVLFFFSWCFFSILGFSVSIFEDSSIDSTATIGFLSLSSLGSRLPFFLKLTGIGMSISLLSFNSFFSF